jgi:signal transduction histidine kinase
VKQLASFVRDNKQRLIDRWIEHVRRDGQADDQSRPQLRDHMPHMIEALAVALETGEVKPDHIEEITKTHAGTRVEQQYDLQELIDDYRILRAVVLREIEVAPQISDASRPAVRAAAVMDEALDMAIGQAVELHVAHRERMRDVFIGILGHDLRSPVSVIRLTTQALLRKVEGTAEPDRKQLNRILENGFRIEKMIADLLDFARGQLGGGIPVDRRAIDLREVVREAVEDLVIVHEGRDIRAELVASDVQGVWDPDRVRQVVSNLVANAVAHGEDPIEVGLITEPDRVGIRVVNRGVIRENMRGRLFDPFTSGGEGGRGLGLGLYIVCNVARAHGGCVEVSSTDAEGTTFTVWLPRSA